MKKVIIIAEAGVNHNGNINIAKRLIDKASDANVDYVKFQTFKANNITSRSASKANYQIKNDVKYESQYEMLKDLELSFEDHLNLVKYCKQRKIKFLSSAFDIDGLNILNKLSVNLIKIPSGEITNYQYLKKVSEINKPIILSTGMSNIKEIKNAINILTSKKIKKNDITILHCNSDYPTNMIDVNLKALKSIQDELKINVGYSDHTLGIEVPIAAVALGAKVIEKHFTLDRNLPGPDHAASLEPLELKKMVEGIRNIEIACSGSGIKEITKSEKQNLLFVRKSLFTKKKIKKGDTLKEELLIALRPGDGISPMDIPKLKGKTFKKSLNQYVKIKIEDFE